jgi:hypothetical protein
MSNYKFIISQDVFVLPIKMPRVIKKHIKPFVDENRNEVGVNYQNRI